MMIFFMPKVAPASCQVAFWLLNVMVLSVLTDHVVTADGYIYEYSSIQKHLTVGRISLIFHSVI